MRYYYCLDGETIRGPFSREVLEQMVRSGSLPSDVQVCQEGTDAWRAFADFIFPIKPSPITAFYTGNITWWQGLLITFVFFGVAVGFPLLMRSPANNESAVSDSQRPVASATPPRVVAASTPAKPKETAQEREARITRDLYRTLAERDMRLERDAEKKRKIQDAIELEKEVIRLKESKQ